MKYSVIVTLNDGAHNLQMFIFKSFIVILDLGKHFAWEFFVQMSMFLNHVKKVLKVKIIINLLNKDILLEYILPIWSIDYFDMRRTF